MIIFFLFGIDSFGNTYCLFN